MTAPKTTTSSKSDIVENIFTVEMPGIEPGAFHMRSERSTTEPHPQTSDLKSFLSDVNYFSKWCPYLKSAQLNFLPVKSPLLIVALMSIRLKFYVFGKKSRIFYKVGAWRNG